MRMLKNMVCLLSTMIAVLMCFNAFAQDKTVYRLMVFGDSLSAGYGVGAENSFASFLEKSLKQKGYNTVQVINRSKSGETTAGGLLRLPEAIKTVRPNGVILELGINDVLKGMSINEAETNLKKMIEICQKNKISILLVGMQAPPYAGVFYQRRFKKMYQTLADKYDLMLYPFFMKGLIELESLNVTPKEDYMLSDNVHPNIKGIQLMVNNILPFVQRFLKQNKVYPSKN